MGARELIKTHDDDFKRGFGISMFLHAFVLAFFIFKMTFFSEPILDLTQAIRVDMVGLPDKVDSNRLPPKYEEILKEKTKLPEKEVAPEKVKPKEVKVDKDVIDLKKSKSKQKAALDKLKKLDALEKIRQDVRNEAKAQPIKGRVVSAGTALTGLDKIDANTYLQGLDQHVKQHWSLPQWLMNRPLKAQVLVKFDMTGKVLSRVIFRSSGEPAYDEQCLDAVDRATPFPVVPEKFSEKFKVDGVVIGFPE